MAILPSTGGLRAVGEQALGSALLELRFVLSFRLAWGSFRAGA